MDKLIINGFDYPVSDLHIAIDKSDGIDYSVVTLFSRNAEGTIMVHGSYTGKVESDVILRMLWRSLRNVNRPPRCSRRVNRMYRFLRRGI